MAQLTPYEQKLIDNNPQAYYAYLRKQGIPDRTATQMMAAKFGSANMGEKKSPGTMQQIGKAVAGIGASVAGYKGGQYVYEKAGELGDKLKNSLWSNTPEATTPNATPIPANTFATTPQAPATPQMPTLDTGGMGTPVPPPAAQAPVSTPMGEPQAGQMGTPTPWSDTVQIDTPQGPMQVPKDLANDSGFLSNVDWNKFGQGSIGALQLYSAYQQYKSGDKVGAGLSGATGAANIAQATGAIGGETAGTVIPGLNIATGAYGAYQTNKAINKMPQGGQRTRAGIQGGALAGGAIGLGVGSLMAAGMALGPMGMLIGAGVGLIMAKTASGKGKAQVTRDAIRATMKEQGILDDSYQGTLADGTKYDFGKDGSTLKWKNVMKVSEQNPEAWKGVTPLTDALGVAYGFVGQKASDIGVWYAKAAVSNANNDPEVAKRNARHFAQQQNITFDMLKTNLDSALADNRINQTQYDSYLAGARDLTNYEQAAAPVVNPTATVRPKTGEVIRVSPGMYRNDQGELTRARSTRQALERNYRRS